MTEVRIEMTCAAGVADSTSPDQGAGPGATPRATLHDLIVRPIPVVIARRIIEGHHYLHTIPAGTRLSFGVFLDRRLLGALTLGVGPKLAHKLVKGADAGDTATLTRLWLSDALPKNAESRVLGVVLRALSRNTSLKFLITYADPAHGHLGTIYQATNWVYTGLSQAMPLFDLGDGVPRHSRSLAHAFGTHSKRYFTSHGVTVREIPQAPKHRYLYFLDPEWRSRLRVPALPFPKLEDDHADR